MIEVENITKSVDRQSINDRLKSTFEQRDKRPKSYLRRSSLSSETGLGVRSGGGLVEPGGGKGTGQRGEAGRSLGVVRALPQNQPHLCVMSCGIETMDFGSSTESTALKSGISVCNQLLHGPSAAAS